MTVGVLLDEWLEEIRENVSHRTWLNREGFVRLHIKPNIGTTKLAKLSTDDVRRLFKRKSGEGMASSSVNKIHVTLDQAILGGRWEPFHRVALRPPRGVRVFGDCEPLILGLVEKTCRRRKVRAVL